MTFDNVLQHIPNLGAHLLYHALCALYIVRFSRLNQTLHYKRLEKFESHFLRQTALEHFQIGSYDDNASSGIVNALTQQILTETALFTSQHI